MLLLFLLLLPLILSVFCFYCRRSGSAQIKRLAAPITFTGLTTLLMLLLVLLWQVNRVSDSLFFNQMLLEFSIAWPEIGLGGKFHLKAHFVGLLMASFVSLSMILLLLISLEEKQIGELVNYPLLLLLTTSYLGLFLSQNLIAFLIFWELVLIFTHFANSSRNTLYQRDIFAAPAVLKLFCSSLLLLVIIIFSQHTGDLLGEANLSFEFLTELTNVTNNRGVIFYLILFAFLPVSLLFPFHSLLTRRQEQNFLERLSLIVLLPPATVYGLSRFLLPLLEDSRWILVTLASLGGFYGALLAFRATNYSSSIEWIAMAGFGSSFATLFVGKSTAAASAIFLALLVSLVLLAMILVDKIIKTRREEETCNGLQIIFTADWQLFILFGLILFSISGLVGSAFFPAYLLVLRELLLVGWLPAIFSLATQFLLTIYCLKLLYNNFPLDSTVNLSCRGIKPVLYILLVLLVLTGIIPGRFFTPLIEDVREYMALETVEPKVRPADGHEEH